LIPGISIGLLFAVLLFLFPFDTGYSTVRDPFGLALWATWRNPTPDGQDYTYCLLVPLIVAYLIYDKRSQLTRTPISGRNGAIFLIVLGLCLFWIGSRAGKQYIGCAAVQILLAGVIFWFWGGAIFRRLLFVWAFLVFAWPLPFVDSAIAFPLRMLVASSAFHVLNFIGIPSIQNGTALLSASNPAAGLQLGDRFQIDIANPCSGINSLLTLLMFSVVFGYFCLKRAWQRWMIFLSAIPFTIIGNVIRILLLVIGCITWGSAFAIGTNETPSSFHEDCGLAVFAVVLGLECLLGFLLIVIERRFSRPSRRKALSPNLVDKTPPAMLGGQSPPADRQPSHGTIPGWRSGVIFGLAAVMLVVAWTNPPPYLPPQAGVLMNLPEQVTLAKPDGDGDEFFGATAPVSDVEHNILPKDTQFARKNYNDLHGHNVFFSIVLSGLQQYTIHPPQVCLVAQGWNILKEENVPIHLSSGHDIVVRNLTIQSEAIDAHKMRHLIQAYYMYWYVADGISTPSSTTRNWLSSWDRVVHNRDHRWAYVIAMSPITASFRPDGLNDGQTRQLLSDFIRAIVPSFQKSEMPESPEFGSN